MHIMFYYEATNIFTSVTCHKVGRSVRAIAKEFKLFFIAYRKQKIVIFWTHFFK